MREEAEKLLRQAQEAEREARLRVALLGGWLLVLWGGLWAAGSLLLALDLGLGGRFWLLAGPLGTLLSFHLGLRQAGRVRSEAGRKTFALWGLLVLFALLHWLPLLPPLDLRGESFLISLVAFGYAYTGVLWRLGEFVWGGLGLFALDLLLFRLFPGLFHEGMALLGLLALILGGVWTRRWTR
jgi:hypothetical protein